MSLPVCSVPWCLAFCAPESDKCVVHLANPDFLPINWDEWDWIDERKTCDNCGGTGQCNCGSCGNVHDCEKCDGEGEDWGFRGWNHRRTGEAFDVDEFAAVLAERTGLPTKMLRAAVEAEAGRRMHDREWGWR